MPKFDIEYCKHSFNKIQIIDEIINKHGLRILKMKE